MLDLPVVSAIAPGDERLFKMAVAAAMNYRPLSDDERAFLLDSVRGIDPLFFWIKR